VDPETQTRIRYHTKATLERGTVEQGRNTLKNDFYGPRIEYYQKYFNRPGPINMKRALHAIEELHKTINSGNILNDKLTQNLVAYFEVEKGVKHEEEGTISSFESFWRVTVGEGNTKIEVRTLLPCFVLPDLRVISIEDVIITSNFLDVKVHSRIVIYQLNESGKIVTARLFDQSVELNPNKANNQYLSAADHYFNVLTMRDIEKVRELYAPGAILEDPVGFLPPRTFDSIYTTFYQQQKFVYHRSPQRTYACGNQVAQLVVANFTLENGNPLTAYPIQILSFDEKGLITRFEALFEPKLELFKHLK